MVDRIVACGPVFSVLADSAILAVDSRQWAMLEACYLFGGGSSAATWLGGSQSWYNSDDGNEWNGMIAHRIVVVEVSVPPN